MPLKVSHHPPKFGGHRHWSSGDIMTGFSLSRNLAKPSEQYVEELKGWKLLQVSHHHAKSGGQILWY